MTPDPKLEAPHQPTDFTDFMATDFGVSRDAAQGLLGEWLVHYQPTLRAQRIAQSQPKPLRRERAGTSSAA